MIRFGAWHAGNPISDDVFVGHEQRSGQDILRKIRITSQYPSAPLSRSIPELPEQVAKAFHEAEDTFAARHVASAAMGYRRTLERALKVLHADGKGMLDKRIRTLEKSNALPASMIDLLDSVKFLGNDAAHELEDPEPEDVETGRDFTHLFLTYVFELPARVEKARAARDQRKQAHSGNP